MEPDFSITFFLFHLIIIEKKIKKLLRVTEKEYLTIFLKDHLSRSSHREYLDTCNGKKRPFWVLDVNICPMLSAVKGVMGSREEIRKKNML